MQLNLPILDQLAPCRNILIAGMGGGFDVFCGLPIFFALQERGRSVHLANLTFSPAHLIDGPTRLTPSLVGVTADTMPFPSAVSAAALHDPQIAAAARQGTSIIFLSSTWRAGFGNSGGKRSRSGASTKLACARCWRTTGGWLNSSKSMVSC
jgi:hypothetical protein